MRVNENTIVLCETLSLWPYRRDHVPKYHAWMQDEEIRQLTASEPLSLQEEYDMQASWREDADKLTFIVVKNEITESGMQESDSVKYMIGDVNLFISPEDDEDQTDSSGQQQDDSEEVATLSGTKYRGELELMIAEGQARRRGYGKAALLLFISWIIQYRHKIVPAGALTLLVVKIGADNTVSLGLFRKIGFVQVHYSEYFREYELHLPIERDTKEKISSLMKEQDRAWQEKRTSTSL